MDTIQIDAIRREVAEASAHGRPLCKACGWNNGYRPGGLCQKCYLTPAIRAKFPANSDSKYARRGVRTPKGRRPQPEPTTAAPGSNAKVAELARRAQQGLQLWHPQDNPLVDKPPRLSGWHWGCGERRYRAVEFLPRTYTVRIDDCRA